MTTYFSQGSVATDLREVVVVIHLPARYFLNLIVKKNYENWSTFAEVTATIKADSFFSDTRCIGHTSCKTSHTSHHHQQRHHYHHHHHHDYRHHFYRATLCVSADFAIAWCPSVRHAGGFIDTSEDIVKLPSRPDSSNILFF